MNEPTNSGVDLSDLPTETVNIPEQSTDDLDAHLYAVESVRGDPAFAVLGTGDGLDELVENVREFVVHSTEAISTTKAAFGREVLGALNITSDAAAVLLLGHSIALDRFDRGTEARELHTRLAAEIEFALAASAPSTVAALAEPPTACEVADLAAETDCTVDDVLATLGLDAETGEWIHPTGAEL